MERIKGKRSMEEGNFEDSDFTITYVVLILMWFSYFSSKRNFVFFFVFSPKSGPSEKLVGNLKNMTIQKTWAALLPGHMMGMVLDLDSRVSDFAHRYEDGTKGPPLFISKRTKLVREMVDICLVSIFGPEGLGSTFTPIRDAWRNSGMYTRCLKQARETDLLECLKSIEPEGSVDVDKYRQRHNLFWESVYRHPYEAQVGLWSEKDYGRLR